MSSCAAFDPDQAVAELVAEKRGNPVEPAVDGRQIVHDAVVVPQRHVPVGVGQRDARERLDRVPDFRLRGAQELAAHRRIEEQLADLERRADRTAAGRTSPIRPPLTSSSAPASASAVRLRISN